MRHFESVIRRNPTKRDTVSHTSLRKLPSRCDARLGNKDKCPSYKTQLFSDRIQFASHRRGCASQEDMSASSRREAPDDADRHKRARKTDSGSEEEKPVIGTWALPDVAVYSPPSPTYTPASPSPDSESDDSGFSSDVRRAVRRFEKVARAEFRALLQQGCPVQVSVERLLAKLSSGMRPKPAPAEVDALVADTGLDPEVASWALMLKEELSRLRRSGTPPPDSVDVLTARLQNSNLDVEPPIPAAVPAAVSVPPPPAAAASAGVPVPAAAEVRTRIKRGADAPISSLEDETQKRRREEKDRMGAVLDAVAAAVRANNNSSTAPPASPPPRLISALLRRSSSHSYVSLPVVAVTLQFSFPFT